MEQRGIVLLEGGPCAGQRFFVWPGDDTVRTIFVDFSVPALPVIKQVQYDVLADRGIAVYAGEVSGNSDSCA